MPVKYRKLSLLYREHPVWIWGCNGGPLTGSEKRITGQLHVKGDTKEQGEYFRKLAGKHGWLQRSHALVHRPVWLLIFQTLRQDVARLLTLFSKTLVLHVIMKSNHCFIVEFRCFDLVLLTKICCYITWTGCSSLQIIASPSLSQRRWTSFPLQASGILRVNLNQQVHHL